MEIIGQRIKELRSENNLTQSELSKQTGLGLATIAHWENDTKTPSVESIIILAKFFKCSADYLLGLED